jgi:pimeloyl-ACP methyl ester carboxylesterase
MPGRGCTFDQITETIDRFTEVIGFDRYAVYVFDYGAPTGFRLAVKHPERITAIISQNGNAYKEGLSDLNDVADQLIARHKGRAWSASARLPQITSGRVAVLIQLRRAAQSGW